MVARVPSKSLQPPDPLERMQVWQLNSGVRLSSTALGHNRGRSGTNGVGGADFEHDTARSPQMNHQPLILRVSDAGNC